MASNHSEAVQAAMKLLQDSAVAGDPAVHSFLIDKGGVGYLLDAESGNQEETPTRQNKKRKAIVDPAHCPVSPGAFHDLSAMTQVEANVASPNLNQLQVSAKERQVSTNRQLVNARNRRVELKETISAIEAKRGSIVDRLDANECSIREKNLELKELNTKKVEIEAELAFSKSQAGGFQKEVDGLGIERLEDDMADYETIEKFCDTCSGKGNQAYIHVPIKEMNVIVRYVWRRWFAGSRLTNVSQLVVRNGVRKRLMGEMLRHLGAFGYYESKEMKEVLLMAGKPSINTQNQNKKAMAIELGFALGLTQDITLPATGLPAIDEDVDEEED